MNDLKDKMLKAKKEFEDYNTTIYKENKETGMMEGEITLEQMKKQIELLNKFKQAFNQYWNQ